MTNNKIRRDHSDPQWSGRLVEGADNGWRYDECTFHHLASHLNAAREIITNLATREFYDDSFDGHGVLNVQCAYEVDPTVHVKMAELFELVDNLQRYLPWVQGWCVAEYYNNAPDILSAHLRLEDARRWADWWVAQAGYRPKHPILVVWLPAPILAFHHPDDEPGRIPF